MSDERNTRIFVTDAGRSGAWGLLRALRHLPGRPVALFVPADDSAAALGPAMADGVANLPPHNAPTYVHELRTYCRERKVDVVLPMSDCGLTELSRRRADFEQDGVRLLSPPIQVVQDCLDVRATYEQLARTHFPPENRLVSTLDETIEAIEDLGYPDRRVYVREMPACGEWRAVVLDANSKRFDQVWVPTVHASCTAEGFIETLRTTSAEYELLISEYLTGDDLGIDVLADAGEIVELVVRRKRSPHIQGKATHMEFRESPQERAWVEKLAEQLKLSGLICVNARYDGHGVLRLLEVRPRPSDYLGMSCSCVHLLAWAIDMAMQDRVIETSEYYSTMPTRNAVRIMADLEFDRAGAPVPRTCPILAFPKTSSARRLEPSEEQRPDATRA